MYKVAFPGATEEEEKREMDWVSDTAERGWHTNSALMPLRSSPALTFATPTAAAIAMPSSSPGNGA